MEIIIGRDDGRVEVFRLASDIITSLPYQIFCREIGEYILIYAI